MLHKCLIQAGSVLLLLAATFGCSQEGNTGGPRSAGSAEPPPTAKEPESSTIVVEASPNGQLADIDTSQTMEVIQRLAAPATRAAAVRQITENPSQYSPPALYAVASAMFSDGNRDEALFWFYLGQLRARSDANKCSDITARQAVSVLNMQHGGPINEYAFKDTEKLRGIVSRVLEWDRTHSRAYDPKWIALHGMGAITGEAEPFASESEWSEIDRTTRAEYEKGFNEGLTQFERIKVEIDTNKDGIMSDEERSAYEQEERARFEQELKKDMQELADYE